MQDRSSWSGMLEPEKDRRPKLKAPVLVGAIVGVHVLAISTVLFIQGCGTTTHPAQREVSPPSTPVMPPTQEAKPAVAQPMPRPQFQPVVAPEPTPVTPEAAGGQTYVIQGGDSLSKIAQRYGVSAREIAELNAMKDPNKIRVGQKILLPAHALSHPKPAAPSKKAQPKAVAEAAPSAKVSAGGDYVVQPGDSLSKIASRHGTTIKAIKEANNLKSDSIRVGQKLAVSGAKAAAAPAAASVEPAPAAEPAPATEPVAVSAASDVLPGATLTPPPATPEPAPMAPLPGVAETKPAGAQEFVTYTFKEGDSLAQIAIDHYTVSTEILKANGLTDVSQIKAGQVLKIPVQASSP
jgi:LysM repeat protein